MHYGIWQPLQYRYVNAKVDDGTDLAELMRIFKEKDAYNFEKFPKVSQRKKQFIGNTEGKSPSVFFYFHLVISQKADIMYKS